MYIQMLYATEKSSGTLTWNNTVSEKPKTKA